MNNSAGPRTWYAFTITDDLATDIRVFPSVNERDMALVDDILQSPRMPITVHHGSVLAVTKKDAENAIRFGKWE
jgi:hypothetical protein